MTGTPLPLDKPPSADWGAVLATHRDRLKRVVALRLDERLRGRLDPSDVIQDAFLEATSRRPERNRATDPMPTFLWLRHITLQQLQLAHRKNLGLGARDVNGQVLFDQSWYPGAASAALAAQLLGRDTRASQAAIRAERQSRIQEALDRMDPMDREVLVLRHFEQLTNGETARVLDLTEIAATKRYLRALRRLKDVLATFPGGLSEVGP
jgi:RNA polymerase sigma-70 factor (ECF subfamily)